MKKVCFAALLLSTLLFSGCSLITKKEPYTFRQSFDQIESIEILKKAYDSIETDVPIEVLRILDTEEHQLIIDALLAADGNFIYAGPATGFGLYIIRINYFNGEAELIGDYNNGYISPEGKVWQECYSFDTEQFYAIISQYVEVEGVPGVT